MLKTLLAAAVLSGASSVHISDSAAAIPFDCTGCYQDDSSWGNAFIVWTFTPNAATNSDGVCDTLTCEWDAPGCKFRGTLKVTNTTGAPVDLFNPDGTGPAAIANLA